MGYNVIYEQEQIIHSIKVPKAIDESIVIDYFDFNNNSIEDFIDYMNLIEYDKYYFIPLGDTNRSIQLISFFEKEVLATEFDYLSLESFLENIVHKNKNHYEIEIKKKIDELSSLDYESIFNQGYTAYQTGRYPENINPGIIKHIFIDSLSNINRLDESIIKACAINSCIYFNKGIVGKDIEDEVPLLKKEIHYLNSKAPKMETYSTEEIFNRIKEFESTGKIEKATNFIKAYDYITGISKFNSLTISGNSIYLDSTMKKYLGKIDDNFFTVYNEFSLQKSKNIFIENFSSEAIFMYLPYFNIKYMDANITQFITPFNSRILPVSSSKTSYYNWIAYQTENEEYFAYNIIVNRLFKINRNFADLFEYIIKGQENSEYSDNIHKIKKLLDGKNGKKN